MEENLKMNEFKPITYSQEYLQKYWEGPSNIFARYFTYFQRAINLLNEGKYILALFGVSIFVSDFKIPPWILISGGILAIPILIFIGRWHLFKVQKATEFINAQHGSITGYGSYNMQVRQVELLEQILAKLNEKIY